MITPTQKFFAARFKSGTALFPVIDTRIGIVFAGISTRSGNAVIDWTDGNTINYTTQKNTDYVSGGSNPASHNYSSTFSGDIPVKFPQGLRDIYSLSLQVLHQTGIQEVKFNIQNFGNFIKQFSNLYSLRLELYAYQQIPRMGVVKGDLADIPNSLKRFKIASLEIPNASTDYWFDFSTLLGKSLEYIDFNFGFFPAKIIGDLGKLPTSANFISITNAAANSAITYTSGKVWASTFDTLNIPLTLTTSELNNLLADIDSSVISKTGAGIISVGGFRSETSNAAVASLQAKGFTVNVKLKSLINDSSVIFRMDFQNNYNVWSNSLIDITSGNGVGSTGNLPTFAPSGRKTGEYCAVFNGSQSIKTTTNLPVNSDKVTVEFAMKTTQTALAIPIELSETMNSNNSFGVWINNATNTIDGLSRNTNYNASRASLAHNGTWNHITVVIDRAENAANEVKIYINGNLATVTKPFNTDNVGNFVNNILYIGQRAGNTLGFNGALMYLKNYNYAFTASEAAAAYTVFATSGSAPSSPTGQKVALVGDSTIAAYACRSQSIAQTLFTSPEIADGWQAVNLAVPGHTINQQLTVWNADANKATYDIIIIQVGLNDMNTASATTLNNYQALINQINATKKVGAKVYISCILPCKQRWTDLGWANGQSNWVALNNAIMGSTFTGVDKRNNAHVALLDDGNGNLAPAYDCGDHIHENSAGGEIIKNAFRAMIF